jgi:hypothetical protein
VEQELLTLTRSLVLYVCFVDCSLSFCMFTFGHCVVCSSLQSFSVVSSSSAGLYILYNMMTEDDKIQKHFVTPFAL